MLGRKYLIKNYFLLSESIKETSAGFVLENRDTLIVCFYYDTISGVINPCLTRPHKYTRRFNSVLVNAIRPLYVYNMCIPPSHG